MQQRTWGTKLIFINSFLVLSKKLVCLVKSKVNQIFKKDLFLFLNKLRLKTVRFYDQNLTKIKVDLIRRKKD